MLENRVALITGSGGSGMGRSTALTLARHGADIVLNYGTNRRDAAADNAAQTVEAAVRALGQRVLTVKADTKHVDEVDAMVAQAVDVFGGVDILVNNASGLWAPQDITETQPEQFSEVLAAEIEGAFYCIRACLPQMRKKRWGRIINLGAFDAGRWAAEDFGPIDYAIGKAGRALLTRHLALKERAYNITVNLVNPGPGHTAHFESVEQASAFAAHNEAWSTRTKVTPQDVAEAILFLCSDQARFITGSHIAFSLE